MTDRLLARSLESLRLLREGALEFEAAHAESLAMVAPTYRNSARNLLHYLSVRQRDIRPLQLDLHSMGLSSLGILEGHVLAAINAVIANLEILAGESAEPAPQPPATFLTGPILLREHTRRLFGPAPPSRSARIMVTMPSEAADDPQLIEDLLRAGMDVMRINCAHDGPEAWRRMASHLRRAERMAGRTCRVQADLAGPKLRTGPLQCIGHMLRLRPTVDLQTGQVSPARIHCTLPAAFEHVRPGHRVWIDDGKIGGIVRATSDGILEINVTHAPPRGGRLRDEKGINFPDSDLNLSALTEKDLIDLREVVGFVDLVALSFLRTAADVDRLQKELKALDAAHVGVVLKIENATAFRNLPRILLASLTSPPVGVMVARGDLAVEVGFERLSELQEEILWLCEAAHVPVIWATQVLEGLAKGGAPTRAEVSDAVMSSRAECVMLNKGPRVVDTVAFLSDILERMAEHHDKRMALLRRLSVSEF